MVLVLGGLVGGLVIAEGVARTLWVDPVSVEKSPCPPPSDASLPMISGEGLTTPNQRGIYRRCFYRTNDQGVRGPNYAATGDPDEFRIVVAGDSVTMGAGVSEEAAYPAQLELLLNAGGGPWRYQVINLGISGLNVHKIMNRLAEIGLGYHPNLIVYGFTLNDIEGPAYQSVPRQMVLHGQQARYDRLHGSPSYLVRVMGPRILAVRDMIRPPEGSYLQELFVNYFDNQAAWADFRGNLSRFGTIARENDLCGLVFLHKQIARVGAMHPFEPIYEKVSAAAVADGLSVSSSHTYFGGYDEESLRISFWNHHPSPLGHRLMARALFDALVALPERCWQVGPGRSARPGGA